MAFKWWPCPECCGAPFGSSFSSGDQISNPCCLAGAPHCLAVTVCGITTALGHHPPDDPCCDDLNATYVLDYLDTDAKVRAFCGELEGGATPALNWGIEFDPICVCDDDLACAPGAPQFHQPWFRKAALTLQCFPQSNIGIWTFRIFPQQFVDAGCSGGNSEILWTKTIQLPFDCSFDFTPLSLNLQSIGTEFVCRPSTSPPATALVTACDGFGPNCDEESPSCCGTDHPTTLKADLSNVETCGCICGPLLDPHNLSLEYFGTGAYHLCDGAAITALAAGSMKWYVPGIYGGNIVLEARCGSSDISLFLYVTCCCPDTGTVWQLTFDGAAALGSCHFDASLIAPLPTGTPPIGCPAGIAVAHITTP